MFLPPGPQSSRLQAEDTPARQTLKYFANKYGIRGYLLSLEERKVILVSCLDFRTIDYHPSNAELIPQQEKSWFRQAIFCDHGANLAVEYGAKISFPITNIWENQTPDKNIIDVF